MYTGQDFIVACTALVAITATAADCVAQPLRLRAEPVITTGLSLPVYSTAPPSDPGSLYISEQNNVAIRVLDRETNELRTFLDLPNLEGQQVGLQRFAFHPEYETNGKIYLNIYDNTATTSDGLDQGVVKIYEFQRSTEDPTIIDPSTQKLVISVDNPSGSHNGGWLDFSPTDGNLYILTGDGGASTSIPTEIRGIEAQNPDSLLGKLLRIDVDGDDFVDDPTRNYAIPEDNPYATAGGRPEVFSLGLRHPFSAGFDSTTGDLYIGDVGSNRFEEINLVPAGSDGGQNFGWREREGPAAGPFADGLEIEGLVDPIHFYSRGSGASVISGFTYRGEAIPDLQGSFVFGDFLRDDFFTLDFDGENVTRLVDRSLELSNPIADNGFTGLLFGTDALGEIYILDPFRGDIFQIVEEEVIRGDYNNDGLVNGDDIAPFIANFGSTRELRADGNGNGSIDLADFVSLRDQAATAAGIDAAAIPEPSTAALMMIGAAVFRRRR